MTSLFPSPRTAFPTLASWLEHTWPFGDPNMVRIEESTEDGQYVVRAELPGFDAEKQITVTSHGGVLTINAQREARAVSTGRSEFHYGSFSRNVSLPPGADASQISARYVKGILELSMPYTESLKDKQIDIKVEQD